MKKEIRYRAFPIVIWSGNLFSFTQIYFLKHICFFLSFFFLWKRIWKIVYNKQFPKCLLLISNSLLFSSFNIIIFISVPCHLDIIQNFSLIHSIRQSNLRVLLITGLGKSNIIHSWLLQVLFNVAFHKDCICMAFLIHKCWLLAAVILHTHTHIF